jgi:hypothetical protein
MLRDAVLSRVSSPSHRASGAAIPREGDQVSPSRVTTRRLSIPRFDVVATGSARATPTHGPAQEHRSSQERALTRLVQKDLDAGAPGVMVRGDDGAGKVDVVGDNSPHSPAPNRPGDYNPQLCLT